MSERDIVDRLEALHKRIGFPIGIEAKNEIISLRAQLAAARDEIAAAHRVHKVCTDALAAARDAALEEAEKEAASWQGLKGRAISDKIRALKAPRP